MLNNINIKGFKSLQEDFITLKPYTIITGLNSSGKSTVIQAALLAVKHSKEANKYKMESFTQYLEDYSSVRNKNVNAKEISISLSSSEVNCDIKITSEGLESVGDINLSFDMLGVHREPELFYLSANRQGQEELALVSSTSKVGSSGQYILGYFNTIKDIPLPEELCKFKESKTLRYQVSQWLSYITETQTELTTEPQSSSQVKVNFNDAKLGQVSPLNLGAGMSYATKVIILCLIAKKGDVVIIENPEIHLHPKAQSLLSSLFSYVSNNGIQIIVETHCEHLINKTRHLVYKKNIESDDVIIHYKKDVDSSFISLKLDNNGHYIDLEGKKRSFPSGFFDSTLNELIEIGG
ncbi:TPA: AAA family ATPase [Vibrio parahaemolyticus]|uniref:AAA family ATPase n=1 Tax=Vibrio parahaemolyticus TaxID=670 RepID=UPI003891F15F|nr:AAA family ATPase [Vibrio parahaemolyticus]